MPAITVVLPVYNGQRYLSASIASVLSQSFSDFELLIGDDVSRDGSAAIIDSFSDPRIRRFRHARNQGLFGNINELTLKARAPLIHFFCQDDRMVPECLQKEVDFFGMHPGIGMSFCKSIIIDAQDRVIERAALSDMPVVVSPYLGMQLFYYFGCLPGNLSTVCVRATSLACAGSFKVSYLVAGDYDMWVRICSRQDLGVIHEHLVYVRNHPLQLSRSDRAGVKFLEETRTVRSDIMSFFSPRIRIDADRYRRRCLNIFSVHFAFVCFYRGRMKDFYRIMRLLGFREWLIAMYYWIITLNNRLFGCRPHIRDLPSE